MPSNYLTDDPLFGTIDLDEKFITDAWLIDRYVGNQLWSWGDNTYGTLGLGDITHRSSPVQVGSLTNWMSIDSADNYYASAIKTDGTLWTWGWNASGNLGLGDRTNRSSPVQVGSLTNWRQVSTRWISQGMAAIKTDGTLWAWGVNNSGQLGLGDTTPRSSPVQVGSLTNWKQVSARGNHTVAIKTDGTLWAWGDNQFEGQLGLGDTTHRSSPTQVGSLTDWKQVSNGYNHTLAIKTDGTLWSWGNNVWKQLGQGSPFPRISSPSQVGTSNDWKLVVGGYYNGFAIKNDGTLWSWGYNANGQLGLTNTVFPSIPTQVGTLTNWKTVSSQYASVTAVKNDGTLWTWGYNANGRLGLGDTTNRSSPTQVGSLTNWKTCSDSMAITFNDI